MLQENFQLFKHLKAILILRLISHRKTGDLACQILTPGLEHCYDLLTSLSFFFNVIFPTTIVFF
jgi:hypothetical protein